MTDAATAARAGSQAPPLDTLTFRIVFRGPFRVGTGAVVPGVDSPLDHECPLPATSLKGAMRAEATEVLAVRAGIVEDIFGRRTRSAGAGSSAARWRWGEPQFETPPQYSLTTRVKISERRGLADESFLAFNEACWAATATFTITPARSGLPADDAIVLRAAARSISGLGSMRRRGFGHVRIVEVDGTHEIPWTEADTSALLRSVTREAQ